MTRDEGGKEEEEGEGRGGGGMRSIGEYENGGFGMKRVGR